MNITLYIQSKHREAFSKEEHKSVLINSLLAAHYGGDTQVSSVEKSPPKKSQPKKQLKTFNDEVVRSRENFDKLMEQSKPIATKDSGPLFHVLDKEFDTVATLPLKEAQELVNKNPGWDRVRA